jgi:hypothetical protein
MSSEVERRALLADARADDGARGKRRVLGSLGLMFFLAAALAVSTREREARANERLGDALDVNVRSVWSLGHLVTPEALGAPRPVATALGLYDTRVPSKPSGKRSPITYTLHMGCESDALKTAFPDFFGPGANVTEARIVYHNFDSSDWFDWSKGVKMEKSNLFPGDTHAWAATTAELNHEWGFALKNAQGRILREIGPNEFNSKKIPRKDLPESALTPHDSCVTSYGGYINRIINIDAARHTERSPKGYVDFTFGTCKESCHPDGEPHEWTAAERDIMTAALEAQPPRGLGFSYVMYGWNRLGVCTMNLYAARSPPGNPTQECEDVVIHFDPRPKWTGQPSLFITDDKRCGTWQNAYAPRSDQSWWWRTDKLGSIEENDDTEWRIDFKYTAGGVEIRMGKDKEYYNLFPWSGDSGVDTINAINTGFNRNYHRSGVPGTCYLSAVWPERAPKDPFYVP